MKKQYIKSISSLIAAVLFFGASSAAWADDPLEIKAWAYPGGSNDWQTGSTGPIFDTSTSDDAYAHAEGSVDYGVIKLYAEAYNAPGPGGAEYGYVQAEWNDVLLFDAPGLSGQQGFATLHYQIDGTFDAGGPSGSSADYVQISLNVNAHDTYRNIDSTDAPFFKCDASGVLGGTNFLNSPRSLDVSFTYGQPLTLRFWIGIDLRGYYEDGSYAIADLSHTATWEGITDIEDSNNAPVQNYTFSSDSGTNFLNPIPEPSVTALFVGEGALAFAFAFAFARRRSRKM